MKLQRIGISNLRVISYADIIPSPAINLISGANASGKTSTIEAIYLLARGVSFRERRLRSIIRDGQQGLRVLGVAIDQGPELVIDVTKTKDQTKVKVNGHPVSKLSVLAKSLPVQLVAPTLQYLFEKEAVYRRRLIDWGLFHVEPTFQELSERYKRVLLQRNRALRNNDESYTAWNPELNLLCTKITELRTDYTRCLFSRFSQLLENLRFGDDVEIIWKRGWNKDLEFLDVLDKNKASDLARGFTQAGPHRADFNILLDKQPLNLRGSRGEQKLLAICLIIAQNMVISEKIGHAPILLFDDLAAELDVNYRKKVFALFSMLKGCQVFITSLDEQLYSDLPVSGMFHVEHGVLSAKGV